MASIAFPESFRVLNILDRGVIQGTRANNTERTTNRTNWNLAIQECTTKGWKMWVPPGRYEIYGGGLIIDDDGFSWEGTTNSIIVQYQLNVPVIHFGPPLASATAQITGVTFSGAQLKYNGTGTAGANAMEFSGIWMSSIKNVEIGDIQQNLAGRSSVPYNGMYFDPSPNAIPQFSNVFENIRIKHFSYRGIDMSRDYAGGSSTQTTFTNVYISGGSSDGQQDNGTEALDGSCAAFFQMQSQLQLVGFNVEWIRTRAAIHFDVCNEVEMTGLNFEGVYLKRFYSTNLGLIQADYTQMKINSGTAYDVRMITGNLSVGSVFMLGDESSVTIDNFRCDNNTTDVPFHLIRHAGGSGSANVNVQLRNLTLNGTHGLDQIDDFVFSGTAGPLYSDVGPFAGPGVVTLPDANYTHYPFRSYGILRMSLTAARTIVLSRQISASDTCRIPRGSRVRVYHAGGGFSLSVDNYTGSTDLATLTAGQSADFVFDGTNWLRC